MAELSDEPAPQVLAFPSVQAYEEHCAEGSDLCAMFLTCHSNIPDSQCEKFSIPG